MINSTPAGEITSVFRFAKLSSLLDRSFNMIKDVAGKDNSPHNPMLLFVVDNVGELNDNMHTISTTTGRYLCIYITI